MTSSLFLSIADEVDEGRASQTIYWEVVLSIQLYLNCIDYIQLQFLSQFLYHPNGPQSIRSHRRSRPRHGIYLSA